MGCLLLTLFAGCSSGPGAGSSFQSNCTLGAISDEARVPAGIKPDGTAILPGGRKLNPAGRLLTIGGFPLAMRVLPGDRYAVVTDGAVGDEHLRIADLQAAAGADPVVSSVLYSYQFQSSSDPALFYGLALTKDGTRLYASEGGHDGAPASEPDLTKHYNPIDVYSITGSPPQLTRLDSQEIEMHFNGTPTAGQLRYPAGLALSDDEKTLYVACQGDGTMGIVDLTAGATYGQEVGRTPTLGFAPYGVLVDSATKMAYVSLWGGQLVGAHDFADGIVPVDVSIANAPMPAALPIPTGKSAEGLISAGGKIYVVSADADAISVIDPATHTSAPTSTHLDDSGLIGSSPNDLAADLTNQRLYVANAGENAVQAFELGTMRPLGRIPTAWYPTAVTVLADGSVVIASAKGMGGAATDHDVGDQGLGNTFMKGTLQVVPFPSESELQSGDATVRENLTRPHSVEVPLACTGTPKKFPLPAEQAATTPIEHVFLIVRENKTYDSVLGDLEGTNGDPSLVMFGEDNTPNIHALARRFANLDNFYSNADQSIQGHEWTTGSISNDYVEKTWLTAWGRSTRPLSAYSTLGNNVDHLAAPGSKTIWLLLDAAGLLYHNYGEAVNIGGAKITLDRDYPGVFFGLGIPDVEKIGFVIDNINDKSFALEPFSYIGLPNDHTKGTDPGYPTPQSMVADNDEATGRFVDALSHSQYWATSIVFIIEDDPSGVGDHVEQHRSICVVASPWVRASYTSGVHYDNPSMWHTITLLLGTGSMNLYDANAAAMYDLFSTTPDLRPYTFLPRKIPVTLNAMDAPLAEESARIDWSRPDTADLGRILWKAVHGRDAEPPWGRAVIRDLDGDD